MNCRDLMTEVVYVCREGDTVGECARMMDEKGIGFVPVLDESSAVIGTVTDRDLALRVLATEKSFETKVRDVMSTDLVACHADDDLETAEEQMSAAKKSRILIVDDENRCIGVISLSDIAQSETPEHVAELLKSVTARESRTAQPSP